MSILMLSKCRVHEIDLEDFQGEIHYVSQKGNLHIFRNNGFLNKDSVQKSERGMENE